MSPGVSFYDAGASKADPSGDGLTEERLQKGRYIVRRADSENELARARKLRSQCFGLSSDSDEFDLRCRHILIDDAVSGALAGCFRMRSLTGDAVAESYTAQFYDLSALARTNRPMLEVGRFCMEPGRRDPDVMRIAWGVMTACVDREGIEMLFGCSSFRGTVPEAHAASFALLRARHLAPADWRPKAVAPEIFTFPSETGPIAEDRRTFLNMPPLLRSYLAMGGRVSDHAVVDRRMNTLHVFTGLEIAAIPERRRRMLRALA